MRKVITIILALLFGALANAQIISLNGEIRYDYLPGEGFKGNAINLSLEGQLSSNVSYAIKQRFNKPIENRYAFQATDWCYLNFQCSPKFSFCVGKQVLYLGGMEYNTAPIDMYFSSILWSELPCYLFGVSGRYAPSASDELLFQICESPFGSTGSNMYSYNLEWNRSHGIWRNMYSLNAMEYAPHNFICYASFGNELRIGKFVLSLDFCSRFLPEDFDPVKDFTAAIITEFEASSDLNIFAKTSYDYNNGASLADTVVQSGTGLLSTGVGLEYYPFECNRNLRVHAVFYYRNGNFSTLLDDSLMIQYYNDVYLNVGITWNLKLLNL